MRSESDCDLSLCPVFVGDLDALHNCVERRDRVATDCGDRARAACHHP